MKKEKRNKDVKCFADAVKTNIGRNGIKGVKSRPPLIEVCIVEETIYFDKPFKSLGKISKLFPRIAHLELKATLDIKDGLTAWRYKNTCVLTKRNKTKLYKELYKECSDIYDVYYESNPYLWQ